jgi:predicted nucleic acid-binding protein
VIAADASSAIELLLNTPAGVRISARLLSSGEALHAPHLIDLEVAQVLRRDARSGELSSQDLGASPRRDGLRRGRISRSPRCSTRRW